MRPKGMGEQSAMVRNLELTRLEWGKKPKEGAEILNVTPRRVVEIVVSLRVGLRRAGVEIQTTVKRACGKQPPCSKPRDCFWRNAIAMTDK